MSPLLLVFAVSVAAPGFEDLDAGPSSDAVADVAWVGDGRAQAVWFNARRDLAFAMERRRGADLWTNTLLPDGGLDRRQGEILCPTSPTEFFSSPRIASNRVQTWVAWKVSLADRDVLRASEISALGRANCGSTPVYDPGPGGRFTGLQLEESAGAFMVLLETTSAFVIIPLTGALATTTTVFAKSLSTNGQFARYDPSLGARLGGGFTVAWSEEGVLQAFDLDGQGMLALSYNMPWSGIMLSAGPVVVGPPLRLAAVGQSANDTNGPLVKAGPVIGTPVDGPPNVTKLLASVEGTSSTDMTQARLRVFGKAGQVWGLTDFTPASSFSALLAQGTTPIAVAGAFNRTAVFADLGGEAGFISYVGPSLSGNQATSTLKSDTNQLLHSTLWLDGGVFAVSYMEGLELRAGSVSPSAPNLIANVNTWANDGGVFRFHPRSSGPGIAVSVQTTSGSVLALTTFSQGQLTSATSFLTAAARGLDEAVVGEHQALFWARGGPTFTAGRGNGTSYMTQGAQMGRCGARSADQLLMPYVNGAELKIVSLTDQLGELAIGRVVRSDALGVESPCLAAFGRELLIVANDDGGNLRVWKMTVDDVLANRQAIEVPVPQRGGLRGVKNPVALGMPWGWQLAWEATDAYGNQIAESTLSFDGGTGAGSVVSLELDGRQPLLAAAPTGEIVVVWQQFIEGVGAVKVRSQRIDRLVWLPDGGVADGGLVMPPDASVTYDAGTPDAGPVADGGLVIDDGGVVFDGGLANDAGQGHDGGLTTDGGLVDDGGVSSDAGTSLDGGAGDAGFPGPSPDGGTSSEPLSFTACGCGPSGDPALMLFGALLFFSARRRRALSS